MSELDDTTTIETGADDVPVSTPVDASTAPATVITALGFDPATVQAVVLTPGAAVAVAVDYPPVPSSVQATTDEATEAATDDPATPEEGDENAAD